MENSGYLWIFITVLILIIMPIIFAYMNSQRSNSNKLPNWLFGLCIIGGLFMFVMPFSPVPLFDYQRGSTGDDGGGGIDASSHLDWTRSQGWTDLNMKWTVRDGYDDVSKGTTETASGTWKLYSGSISAASEMAWKQNLLTWEDVLAINAISLLDSGTASSGVCTTTTLQFDAGVEYLMSFGTYNADNDADDPLKTQFWRAVCQDDKSVSKPTTVPLGLGIFDFWGTPDDDTDLSCSVVTDIGGAVTDLDKDDSSYSDNTFELQFRLTFADADYGLRSYYNPAKGEWWHWYIVVDIYETNTTACTTGDAATMSVTGYTGSGYGINDGYHYVVQLTDGIIHTTNAKPTTIAYDLDANGDLIPGQGANHDIPFVIDTTGVSFGGTTDDGDELSFTIDWGTTNNLNAALIGGILPDSGTTYNYHVAGAATYYIVT